VVTEERAVEEAMRARAACLVSRDGAALRALLHREFVYTNTEGRLCGPEEYIASTTAGDLHWQEQTFEEVQVASEGPVVIVTAHVVDTLRWNDERVTWRFATTQVYVPAEDGRLLYRAGHTSGDGLAPR
jgi:hypothetical protein